LPATVKAQQPSLAAAAAVVVAAADRCGGLCPGQCEHDIMSGVWHCPCPVGTMFDTLTGVCKGECLGVSISLVSFGTPNNKLSLLHVNTLATTRVALPTGI
jgi:hypothetical protein